MKEKLPALKIFNFSHPLMNTEMFSVVSDKYSSSLPFEWTLVTDYSSAEVVVWDGVITPKNESVVSRMIEDFRTSKILLLTGVAQTLLKNHPLVKIVGLEGLNYVEVPGWNVLPEEILAAIEICHQKLKHV